MSDPTTLRVREYLRHIIEAVRRIDEYVADLSETAFLEDSKTQDAVIRNLEIIGEACNNILKRHPDFAAQHSQVPWTFAYEMRNVLSHGYFQGRPGDRLGNYPKRSARTGAAG